jgi:predicted nucleic acid-binding protein
VEDRRILLFLDACVLIAASHSSSGGSALVIEVCQGRRFKAAVSLKIIFEARTNIINKFGNPELIRFYRLLAAMDPAMIPIPVEEKLDYFKSLVPQKDIHVLASALQCGAQYLITLDRRHLINPVVLAAGLNIKIMTPGDFLKEVAS